MIQQGEVMTEESSGDATTRTHASEGAATETPAELSPLAAALVRPQQQEKLPPCRVSCASGADIRGWINIVAQRQKLELSDAQAFAQAWNLLAAANPFPSTLGRICPHPCEANCNRGKKDGVVAIHAMERFLGDWALKHELSLPRLEEDGGRPESIGVIGAGPAGLSFAYQMARRGYPVTIYEKEEKPGGMLYYGIPQYRLPEDVLELEMNRILELGIDLKLNTAVGADISVADLRNRHDILFLVIGAGRGLRLGIPGEEGAGVWTGTEYLARLNRGEAIELGAQVVVVGGGNTAVDAARTARRSGAQVTILYRRTRHEMPAIETEVDDALAEGVVIEYLAAPVELIRDNGKVRALIARRMELGEPDSSGRRAPVAVEGSEYEVPAESVIAAVSQQPNWDGLGDLAPGTVWVKTAGDGKLQDRLWAGGDSLGLGIAGLAIGQGRRAAEAVHAELRGLSAPGVAQAPAVSENGVKADYYAERKPIAPVRRPVEEWLAQPDAEICGTIGEEEFLQEVSHCLSCGLCYGCGLCFMYCNAGGFSRMEHVAPGAYFALSLERCEACGKCIELCPCGFLGPR